MCGVAGFLGPPGASREELEGRVGVMAAALRHRGPDDGGTWVDEACGVALGHRRLSVVDLSPLGHQPMVSASGRFVLSFNGELYNFGELRDQLEAVGHRFRGRSDTEVVVEAIDEWGLGDALRRFNAMFALAVWDRGERRLHLARDRMGEKPLYWAWAGSTLLFASELTAIRREPSFDAAVDPDALALYLRHACVPAPHCIYRGAGKLLPGHRVTVTAEDVGRRHLAPRPYWSPEEVIGAGAVDDGAPPGRADLDRLLDELDRAVRMRMVADVPVGALLSGGIDSTLVTALMRRHSAHVRTFTVGFGDAAYDESVDAAAVATHLGTDHTTLKVTPEDALAVVPRLADLYDEPFADPSQVPTALIAGLARRDVTVVLSGDGGDELFAGYNRHLWAGRIAGPVGRIPRPLRAAAGVGLAALPPDAVDRLARHVAAAVPAAAVRNPATKVAKLASVLSTSSIEGTYTRLVSLWPDPAALVPGGMEPPTILGRPDAWSALADPVEQMMYLDMVTYLPDDILTKVDRASMAVALEARIPLLDPGVVQAAWALPRSAKLQASTTKWALRRLLDRFVPSELVDRPKMGFGMPIDRWLREELRPWAEELLAPDRLAADGLLDPTPIRTAWQRHLSGRVDAGYRLWAVLAFQQWRERWAAA